MEFRADGTCVIVARDPKYGGSKSGVYTIVGDLLTTSYPQQEPDAIWQNRIVSLNRGVLVLVEPAGSDNRGDLLLKQISRLELTHVHHSSTKSRHNQIKASL